MRVSPTPLAGVVMVDTPRREDPRGSFARLFCEQELSAVIGHRRIVQINQSTTAVPGTVRGMHYQRPPYAEMKLVRCLRGRVWDVAVDLRAGSPTFLRWHAEELTPANGRMLVIPEGCAHGFQALEAESELLYLHTAVYDATSEAGVHCLDPRLAIGWPMTVLGLSQRDAGHPAAEPSFRGIVL